MSDIRVTAKDKIDRKKRRCEKRKALNKYKLERASQGWCDNCGGKMTWCCNMWSQTCCEEWGTCPCS